MSEMREYINLSGMKVLLEPIVHMIHKNMQFASDDEVLDMLSSIDALPVLADENDTIYTDEADNILLI